MRAVLFIWAGAATILAIHFATRDQAAPTRARRVDQKRAEVLERRVQELQTALAATLTTEEMTAKPDDPEFGDLVDSYRMHDGNLKERRGLLRSIYARLASDPSAHLELAEMLGRAGNDDEAFTIIELLVLNPFTRLTRNSDVTRKIAAKARALLVDGEEWQRGYAARVLYEYARPSREDVLLGFERLGIETDEEVRDTLLTSLSDHARGIELTADEAAPFLDAMREHLAKGETWTASAIAEWSADEADFERFRAGFRAATKSSTRQNFLNAFRAETRMGGRRADECRAFLLEVLADESLDKNSRRLAASFLEGYAPWDAETAERIRAARK